MLAAMRLWNRYRNRGAPAPRLHHGSLAKEEQMCAVRMRAGGDRRVLAQVFKSGIAAAAVTCCMPLHAPAQTGSTIALDPMTLEGAFLGREQNKPATDISGMACMPPVGTRRTCLLVNDENKNAQFATIFFPSRQRLQPRASYPDAGTALARREA